MLEFTEAAEATEDKLSHWDFGAGLRTHNDGGRVEMSLEPAD